MKPKFIIFLTLVVCITICKAQVSDYADSGNGNHKDDILWLTWAGTDLDDGIHDNDQVVFNMPLGGNITATFSQVSVVYPIPDPTPGDGEHSDGYLPADMKTWCGATLYTAYDISSSSSEVLHSDVSASTGLGNGENGQDIAFKITYNMTINGYTIPVDVVTGDPETTNSDPSFSESINIQNNINNWELIENIRGTNYGLIGLGTNNMTMTETEAGAACASNVNSGTNSSPLLLAKGVIGVDTELDYDIPFPTGNGHEGVVFGLLLPFDQGDAPASYGVASHLQVKNATVGPELVNASQLYLGSTRGDSDYHGNNPLFSANADGDNNNDISDEDGLTKIGYPLVTDTETSFTILASDISLNNTTGSNAQLHSWIDFDKNGFFDSDEYAVSTVNSGATQPNTDLTFAVPVGLTTGDLISRFRLTSDNTLNSNTPTGAAIDGEVEDFQISLYYPSATIDFDGINDYVSSSSFMNGWSDATMMAWVKMDSSFNSDGDVGGHGNMRMYINGATKKLHSYFITNSSNSAFGSASPTTLEVNQWCHVAISYQGDTGMTKLYINGELDTSGTIPSGTLSTNPTYAGPDFNIGRHSRLNNSFFKGAIDEFRVFNSALTEDQLQRMIYQEIENKGGNVTGTLIDKTIQDISTNVPVPWNNLQAYYPMSDVINSKTSDGSVYNREATLHNITTYQRQTAPMPYETVADGSWTTEGTWLHGDVWDIEDITNNKPWSIVHIKNDVTTVSSHTQLGMFIDADKTLTVGDINSDNQNFEINNSWYLQLDGTLDLQDDSQLIQGANSDLVTSATGKILRRQEGNSSVFWYNYWSSPVGNPSATSLTNNNGTINNANNSPFNLAMIKDGTETALEFTSSFDEVGKISNRWLYSFQNGQDYYDWIALTPASEIAPGIGYTQKGTGVLNANNKQEYIFDGKPNNGTILIAADDVDGDSATESDDGSRTTTLIGNPYPSALDARQFIADNSATINGTILLWEQWAGNSHILAEYEGGYGYINAMTTERAYQYAGVEIADPMTDPSGEGIKRPTFYIPVGQGFFVEVVEDGDIEFNNTQRVFIKEGDALIDQDDPNYAENGSSFFRNANNQSSQTSQENEEENPYQLIRMEFKTSAGDSRRFVLGFSETATDGFDYGLDGGYIDDVPEEDMGSIFEGKQYAIQAFAPITPEKEIDLNLNASGNHTYSIKAVEFSNLSEVQNVYLRDNLTGTYFDLRNGDAYEFTSPAGAYNDRFDVVFKAEETLSTDSFNSSKVLIYNNRLEHKLYIKGLDQDAKNLSLTNIIGQTVKSMVDVSVNKLENGFFIGDLSSGVYLVNIKTQDNINIDKKIIIE